MRYVIDTPLSGITTDSRKVKSGNLFLAYPGYEADGRDYIAQAIERGAEAVLWDDKNFSWNADWKVQNQAVPNLQYQAGGIASQFYKKPSADLWMVGITGTNGKTSVSHWVAHAMQVIGKTSAIIGTLGTGLLESLSPSVNTTPGAVDLQSMLAQFKRKKADVVAMEVSSHALDQGRVNGVAFDIAVFTNLTQDHLDYHKTMKAYEAAKRKLFAWEGLKAHVINVDDKFGKRLAKDLKAQGQQVFTYGLKAGDIRAADIRYFDTYFTALLVTHYGSQEVKLNLTGEFNAYNVLAVLGVMLASEVPFEQAIGALETLKPVPGRMEMYGGGEQSLVIVDYAHTPDALEKVLSAIKKQNTSKVVCVFGCGGERDVSKRAKMGYIASKYADAAIVTSDNPRGENPKKIIQDVTASMSGNFLIEADRAKAISIAIMAAKAGDVVLVAGKGHETYQEIKGEKHYFSDAEEVQKALAAAQEVTA